MEKRVFSLPINPKISEEFVNNIFIPFLDQYKHLLFDLYFTCRMPPFEQDAMGDVFISDPRETTLMLSISLKKQEFLCLQHLIIFLFVQHKEI